MLRRVFLERVNGISDRARADRRFLESLQRHAEGSVPVVRQLWRLLMDLLLTVFVVLYLLLRLVMRNAEACLAVALAAALYVLFLYAWG